MKRLYKSKTNKVISGVCGGIAEYFNVDPTLVRVIWALATFFTAFSGLLVYIVCAIVMPEGPSSIPPDDHMNFSN